MATITNLGFNIFSRYDGSGVRRARRDLAELHREMQRVNAANAALEASTRRLEAAQNSLGGAAARSGRGMQGMRDNANALSTSLGTTARSGDRLGSSVRGFTPAIQRADENVRRLGAGSTQTSRQLTVLNRSTGGAGRSMRLFGVPVPLITAGLLLLTPILMTAAGGFLAITGALGVAITGLGLFGLAMANTEVWRSHIDRLSQAWKDFLNDGLEPVIAAPVKAWVDLLIDRMGLAEGPIRATAAALTTLANFMRSLTGENTAFARSWDTITQAMQPIIEGLGRAVINFLIGFLNITAALVRSGLVMDLVGGIENASLAFRRWSETLDTNRGFQNFTNWVRTHGPRVMAILRDVAMAIGHVIAALAPLGMAALEAVGAFARFIRSLEPETIRKAALALIALWLAFKGFFIIKAAAFAFAGFSNAVAMLTAPSSGLPALLATMGRVAGIALRVAGWIGLVVSALILAWQHSGFFRDAVGELWVALQRLWEKLQPLWRSLQDLWAALEPLRAIIGVLAGLILGVLVQALTAIVTVIGWVVQGITLLLQGLTGLLTHIGDLWRGFVNGLQSAWNMVWPALQGAWNSFWNGIRMVAQAIWSGLQTAWRAVVGGFTTAWNTVSGALAAAWNAVWNAIRAAAQAVWNALTGAWRAFVGGLATAWSSVSGALSGAWNAFWNGLRTAAQAIWSALTGAWRAFVSGLSTAWNAVSGALRGAWNAFWGGIRTAAEAVWNALRGAWNGFLNGLRALWNGFSGALRGAWNAFWNGIRSLGQSIWNGIRGVWDGFLRGLRALWDGFSRALVTAWSAFWNGIRQLGQSIWNGIRGVWDAFLRGVRGLWNAFATSFATAWRGFWNAIRELGQQIWNSIRGIWNAFTVGVRGIWNAFATSFGAAWRSFWNGIRQIGESIWNAIRGLWDAFTRNVRRIWDTFAGAFQRAWESTWNTVRDIARRVWDSIGGVIEDAINGIIGIINKLIGGFNKITGFLKLDIKIGEIPRVNFAHGGTMSGRDFSRRGGTAMGYAPGRDRVPAMLSPGEGVLVPEAVRGLGGPGFVSAANSHFSRGRTGRGGPSFGFARGGNMLETAAHMKFASGGMVPMQNFAVGGITAAALARAGVSLGMVSQGEYSTGVAASAGTHDRGGVVDLGTTSPDVLNRLRAAGFAAWIRTPAQGFSPHIHAVLMNHPDLSGPARAQVSEFLNGGDGLKAGGGGGDSGGGFFDFLGDLFGGIFKGITDIGEGLFKIATGDLSGLGDILGKGAGLLGMIGKAAFEKALGFVGDLLGKWDNPAGQFGEILIAMVKKLLSGLIDFLVAKDNEAKKRMEEAGGSGGGGNVQRWSALAAQALARAGIDAGQLGAFLRLMQAESAGNPNAINRWDSNARRGQPSQGLMQVIPSTFAAYRDKSLSGNILDPLANMVASARYIKARYGGRVPGSPYALGTTGATGGWHMVGEEGPEWVRFRGGEKVLPSGQLPPGRAGDTTVRIKVDARGATREAVQELNASVLPQMRQMFMQGVGAHN